MKKKELDKLSKEIIKRAQKELLAMAKKVNRLEREKWELTQQLFEQKYDKFSIKKLLKELLKIKEKKVT